MKRLLLSLVYLYHVHVDIIIYSFNCLRKRSLFAISVYIFIIFIFVIGLLLFDSLNCEIIVLFFEAGAIGLSINERRKIARFPPILLLLIPGMV